MESSTGRLTKALAMDCEMVGVGEHGVDSILARVSLVNEFCECVYDKYVMATEKVTDFRTKVSGIRANDLKKGHAFPFDQVQKEVSKLIEGRILVGHAIHNDLKVLFLSHPKKKIRDTQRCKIFRTIAPSLGGLAPLKKLAKTILDFDIQDGEHDSVQDAQATMRLYKTYKKEWETYLRTRKLPVKDLPTINNQKDDMTSKIKGNDKHKRFVVNKIRRRNNFLKLFKNK